MKAGMSRFEQEYGSDPKGVLARKIINDPFKAPEVRILAHEHLDDLDYSSKEETE